MSNLDGFVMLLMLLFIKFFVLLDVSCLLCEGQLAVCLKIYYLENKVPSNT